MSELFLKLGIDWKLLLAQAANFLILLVVLRLTVYTPLLTLLKTRRQKIEQGLEDAKLAGEKLAEAELMKREKLAEAERSSLALIKDGERKGKELEASLLVSAKKKEADILTLAKTEAARLTEEERNRFFGEATSLIKQALTRVAESSPESIDEKLISQVVANLKKS